MIRGFSFKNLKAWISWKWQMLNCDHEYELYGTIELETEYLQTMEGDTFPVEVTTEEYHCNHCGNVTEIVNRRKL